MYGKIRTAALALTLAGASAVLIAYPRAAPAAEDSLDSTDFPKSYRDFMKMKAMDVMHRMDEGKKGYVTKEEYMKFHEALFDRMDRNHDGKVDDKEWMMAARAGERAK